MLAAQRRELLVARLHRDGRLVAKQVAAELGVAEDSVRRDLRELAAAGLCQRVYGGALPVSPAVADYGTRRKVAVDSKERVAAAAVQSSWFSPAVPCCSTAAPPRWPSPGPCRQTSRPSW